MRPADSRENQETKHLIYSGQVRIEMVLDQAHAAPEFLFEIRCAMQPSGS